LNPTWPGYARANERLGKVSHHAFTSSTKDLAPHRIGSHLRHILEFYECFLDGLDSSHIDYDARKRDESIERSRTAAAMRIYSIIERLENNAALRGDSTVSVRMEDAYTTGIQDCFVTSSIGRELQVLRSHTIHHFALIAMTTRAHGIEVDATFGVAPSTLRHQASKQAAGASTEAA